MSDEGKDVGDGGEQFQPSSILDGPAYKKARIIAKHFDNPVIQGLLMQNGRAVQQEARLDNSEFPVRVRPSNMVSVAEAFGEDGGDRDPRDLLHQIRKQYGVGAPSNFDVPDRFKKRTVPLAQGKGTATSRRASRASSLRASSLRSKKGGKRKNKSRTKRRINKRTKKSKF